MLPNINPGEREGGGGRVGGSTFLPPKHALPPTIKNAPPPLVYICVGETLVTVLNFQLRKVIMKFKFNFYLPN